MTHLLRQNVPHTDVPALAMPIGGIGTGGFAVNADGSLRQWQLIGMPNHRGALPGTGFWMRVSRVEPPLDTISMVQGSIVREPTTPLVTDAAVPAWMAEAAAEFGTFESARFSGTYPIARVELTDRRHPVRVDMHVLNPMVPRDVESSSIPAALFEFTLTNVGVHAVHGTFAGSLLNAVGWDGVTTIAERTPGLGGNVNRLRRGRGWSRVVMDNPALDEADRLAGQMTLAADDENAAVLTRCAGIAHLRSFLMSRSMPDGRARIAVNPRIGDPQLNAPLASTGASAAEQSWLGVVGVPFRLGPGESRKVRFTMCWHFPNRMVDFEQFGSGGAEWGSSRFFIGNAYAHRFLDALDVQSEVESRWEELAGRTESWTSALVASSLDIRETERLAAQAAYVRSPTCFIGADGRFYGFEGSLGASTAMWTGEVGGSCPLNCTHVWQYEAALSGLWPSLERNMRDTEFDVMQAPSGAIADRLRVPAFLPQLTYGGVGQPAGPALDGLLGTILKTLRDVQRGAGLEWLERRWPALVHLYEHIVRTWDGDGDGVLRGSQPSTFDIDLTGVNPFMGSLWLASLRALEELARMVDEIAFAERARNRFEAGSGRYDELMFDGTQYVQILDDGESSRHQWLRGTLSDQVIGQWWAHQLGLGYVLPREHVRSALRHVVATNLRHGFHEFRHPYRRFADTAADVGLVLCSWPDGGRPDIPLRYCDEVWSGSEWQVAAHCIFEGLDAEAEAVLHGLWSRHDGARRNPYNEIECGDHYARAMAGWTILQARSGVHVDEHAGVIRVSRDGCWPWVTSRGYGRVEVAEGGVDIDVIEGAFDLEIVRSPST